MKINHIILIFIFWHFLYCSIVIAQESKSIDTTKICCSYTYNFFEDSTSKYSLKSQNMVLLIGSNLSKFSTLTQIRRDLQRVELHNSDPSHHINELYKITSSEPINPMCNYIVIKNYKAKDTIHFVSNVNRTSYHVTQVEKFDWSIVLEMDTTILGYLCQKATTRFGGRDYIAWFTTEIPISDGPYKFKGLPGLIVQICDTKKQHCFTLSGVEKQKNTLPIIISETNSITTSPSNYVKAFFANNARILEEIQAGVKYKFNDEESKSKAIQKFKSRNSFIERY